MNKDNNRQTNNLFYLFVFGIIIVFLVFKILSLSTEVNNLGGNIDRLELDLRSLSKEVEGINAELSIVSDTNYSVETINESGNIIARASIELLSNKLDQYEEVEVEYKIDFDSKNEETHDWKSLDLIESEGLYQSKVDLLYSCNYILRVSYLENGNRKYFELPSLDIYSKAENAFMKGITIDKLKNNKLDYTVQIAGPMVKDNRSLESAICEVYLNGEKFKAIDIVEENKIEGRKKPRRQIEHIDSEYLFVIDEIDFNIISDFKGGEISIKLILIDSLGNTYETRKTIDL